MTEPAIRRGGCLKPKNIHYIRLWGLRIWKGGYTRKTSRLWVSETLAYGKRGQKYPRNRDFTKSTTAGFNSSLCWLLFVHTVLLRTDLFSWVGVGFESSSPHPTFHLLPAYDCRCELSASCSGCLLPCLPCHYRLSRIVIQNKLFLLSRVAFGHVVYHNNKEETQRNWYQTQGIIAMKNLTMFVFRRM